MHRTEEHVESFHISAYDASGRPPYIFSVLLDVESRVIPPMMLSGSSKLSVGLRNNSTFEELSTSHHPSSLLKNVSISGNRLSLCRAPVAVYVMLSIAGTSIEPALWETLQAHPESLMCIFFPVPRSHGANPTVEVRRETWTLQQDIPFRLQRRSTRDRDMSKLVSPLATRTFFTIQIVSGSDHCRATHHRTMTKH